MLFTIEEIKHRVRPVAEKYSLRAVYIFGSYARNEANADSDVDILTAKNAGMLSVGCSWGYREREVLSKSGVDLIVDKPTDLLEIFG